MTQTHLSEDPNQSTAATAVAKAAAMLAHLRGPDGCPWDREQTFDSIKRHTLEETYEVFDAIERRAWPELQDELGDLLLQVLFYAQMASEAGYFTLADVANSLSSKLFRRHPHVFAEDGSAQPATVTTDDVRRSWEQIKRAERRDRLEPASRLDEIPRSMPAMLEATKLGAAAAKVGFDWSKPEELFAKIAEESDELRVEVERSDAARVEAEFGDLLFTMANLGRHLHVDTESALRGTNARFRARFAAMEVASGSVALAERSSTELEALWSAAKLAEGRSAR